MDYILDAGGKNCVQATDEMDVHHHDQHHITEDPLSAPVPSSSDSSSETTGIAYQQPMEPNEPKKEEQPDEPKTEEQPDEPKTEEQPEEPWNLPQFPTSIPFDEDQSPVEPEEPKTEEIPEDPWSSPHFPTHLLVEPETNLPHSSESPVQSSPEPEHTIYHNEMTAETTYHNEMDNTKEQKDPHNFHIEMDSTTEGRTIVPETSPPIVPGYHQVPGVESYPEMNSPSTEREMELLPHTESIPGTVPPESLSKSESALEMASPEMSTVHPIIIETIPPHIPQQYTYENQQIPANRPSEEATTTGEHYSNYVTVHDYEPHQQVTEVNKPFSEPKSTEAPAKENNVDDHGTFHTGYGPEFIPGYTADAEQQTEISNPHTTMKITSTESISENEQSIVNQTEHGAGSMRSLNLEHSTTYVQPSEMDLPIYNRTSEQMNSSEATYLPIEPEMKFTNPPTTMVPPYFVTEMHEVATGLFSPIEQQNVSPGTEMNIRPVNYTMTDSDILATEQTPPASEHSKELNTVVGSMGEVEQNSTTQIVHSNSNFAPGFVETTVNPENVELTETNKTSISTEELSHHLILPTSEVHVEITKNNTMDNEKTVEAEMSYVNTGTSDSVMEMNISQMIEPVINSTDEDDTSRNHTFKTNVDFKYEEISSPDNTPMITSKEKLTYPANVDFPQLETGLNNLNPTTFLRENDSESITDNPAVTNMKMVEITTMSGNLSSNEKEMKEEKDDQVKSMSTLMDQENSEGTTMLMTTFENVAGIEVGNDMKNETEENNGEMPIMATTVLAGTKATEKSVENESKITMTTTTTMKSNPVSEFNLGNTEVASNTEGHTEVASITEGHTETASNTEGHTEVASNTEEVPTIMKDITIVNRPDNRVEMTTEINPLQNGLPLHEDQQTTNNDNLTGSIIENVSEQTTIKMDHVMVVENDTMKFENKSLEHLEVVNFGGNIEMTNENMNNTEENKNTEQTTDLILMDDTNNGTSTEHPNLPLNKPHVVVSAQQMDEMPMISVTQIPDLLGPYSVDSIIDPSTSYPTSFSSNHNIEGKESLLKDDPSVVTSFIGNQPNDTLHYQLGHHHHQEEADTHTDITADTLNSLDDDYNEEDKKKYYKPSKTKNYKNFKLQEVSSIPIDSLADETTKDVIHHSKELPEATTRLEEKKGAITTSIPTVSGIKDELNSNDAFTTISPLFQEQIKNNNQQIPGEMSKVNEEHINGLFFSNEAETTITPIFDNTLNLTSIVKNSTKEMTNDKLHFVDNLNQLEDKGIGDNKEVIKGETLINNNENILQNSTSGLNDTDTIMNNTTETSNINSSNTEITQDPASTGLLQIVPEISTTKIENISATEKELPNTQFNNSSGLLEINLSAKCATGQFACADGSGCIKIIQRCDNVRDCDDGSDEMICEEQKCLENFQCQNRACLKRSLVCDSIPHCEDGSDEVDCENWKCKFDEIRCPNNSMQCIPALWKCDGKGDCKDNSDEFGCRKSCANDEFFCSEGRCIPHNSTCNGINDCLKGEDEMHCGGTA